MEYEKEYNALVGQIKKAYLNAQTCSTKAVLEDILTSLSESEDERIRKELIFYLGDMPEDTELRNGVTNRDVLAWLEKQESVGEIVERCKESWYNEGKIAGMAEGLSDEEKYQQGWHDALEKQDEPNPYSGTSFKYNGHTWGMCARDNGVEILVDGHIKGRVFTDDSNAKEMFIKALERVEEQNAKGYKLTDCDKNSWWEDFKAYTSCTIEQKPADMVEPKFHEGEWIVYNGDVYHIGNIALERYYECLRVDGTIHTFGFSIDNKSHIWTIQDAKDGNVLQLGKVTAIFKKYIGQVKCICYCSISEDGDFEIPIESAGDNIYGCTNVAPATKEQRDTLFAKMKEAGYKWDAENKELTHIDARENLTLDGDLMEADCMVVEQKPQRMISAEAKEALYDKPAWSEEDEDRIKRIYRRLWAYRKGDTDEIYQIEQDANWLKSLRPQSHWKPSEEQMRMLKEMVVAIIPLGEVHDVLETLYDDLNKLRKE